MTRKPMAAKDKSQTESSRPNWLPVISFFSILFILFSIGSIINPTWGGVLAAGAIWPIGIINSFFSDHFKVISTYWTNKILPETHIILIIISVLIGGSLLAFICKSFQLSIDLKRKP